ncbi:GPI mannosyltransferase 3 [Cylas formicarius]|uniref:GPI mannosyltransferase 3 n=1 Tax=Cylas formicarius TaxID=197179 RepID=UPI0029587DC1|nr:GPI mannosyltransferase 3 [Cylas formicarius]
MENLDVFLIFLSVRILSVFCIQSFFVPDEYWQSLEVAHKLVFGYGYLTWEWVLGIRSYIHPLLVAIFYKSLYLFGLDSAFFLISGPRLLQAVLSSYADLCFYRWSGTKNWAVFSISSSWFLFYTASRTLINSFECSLSTIALSKYPWVKKDIKESCTFIWIVTLLFMIRPTSAVIWLPLCLFHLSISEKSGVRLMVTRYIPIGVFVVMLVVLIDSLAHGSFIVSPYNFFKINIFQNIASNYGEQPWHWYLSCGIPAILGIQILPFAMAVSVVIKNRHSHINELVMLVTIVFSVFVFSFINHKEFRFLLPLLPIMLYISSRFLSAWSRKANVWSVWLVSAIIFLGNVVPTWYLGFVHQRGTLEVMDGLRDIANKDPNNSSFLFLMPCHSTPLYSHLHVNVTTRFLTCNPNINEVHGYVDETDYFYKNPNGWLRQNYPPKEPLPSHIICFDNLLPIIGGDILTRYKRIKQIFHCNIPVSSRIGRFVLVYERLDL